MTDKSNKEVYIQDDEIDLGALFKTIFDYKYIVIEGEYRTDKGDII